MKNLPDGWVIKLLDECIEKEIPANKLKIPQNGFQVEGKYPIIDQGVEYIAGFTDDSSKIYKGELPVIIFGDHTRIFKFVDFPFALGADGTKILVPKKILHPKYFYFFLNGLIIENHGYSRHYKFLKEKQIVIPPLPTQKKIAAVLEKAEKLREWRKEADGLTDSFLKSTFLEMFGDPVSNPKGWDVNKLYDLLKSPFVNGLYLPKERYVKIGGIEMVHMSDAFYGIVERGNLKQVDVNEKELKKYNIDHNDILIARRSLNYEGSAKPCRIPQSNEPLVFESSLIKLSLNQNKILPIYLYYYLNNERAINAFVLKYVTKSTISGINQSGLNKIEIVTPPIELQNKFAGIVEQVEQMQVFQSQSRQHIENLFNVLMQRAFRGELEAK